MRIQIMRKLMILMIDLVLLILVGVQAINLASTSFASLFTSNLVSILLSNWSCKNKALTLPWRDWRLWNMSKDKDPKQLAHFIMENFEVCIKKFEHEHDPVYQNTLRIMDYCRIKHKTVESPKHYFSFVNCLLEMFKLNIKRPWYLYTKYNKSYLQFWSW